ncbi:hypothetical protein F4678DRAFT_425537 [Xylaria arbuscula]|nr:hypothetical protein F4678DRAFT_425537 [Xylaria arbuscula]
MNLETNAESGTGISQCTQGELAHVEPPYHDKPLRTSNNLMKPVFTVKLTCPTTITPKEIFEITVIVTYEGISSKSGQHSTEIATVAGARPVTFHTLATENPLGLGEGFYSYWRKSDSALWEECDLDYGDGGDVGCYGIADDPDVTVRVGQEDDDGAVQLFVTLEPGQSWTTTRRLQDSGFTNLLRGAAVGDVFRYTFRGAAVDWWDWGSKGLEHRDTTVKLPCWIAGEVTEPSDNGGRPAVIMPSSEDVEFTLVE